MFLLPNRVCNGRQISFLFDLANLDRSLTDFRFTLTSFAVATGQITEVVSLTVESDMLSISDDRDVQDEDPDMTPVDSVPMQHSSS